jgi:hypothetical protein
VSEDTKQKGISNKKKLGIAAGVVAVAGLVAGAIFTKGKTLSPANFAEHIEFSPAKTMEEAAAFAKKHLGIQNFNLGDDVEMANWVNKALTNINNRFKGKAQMPKNINFGEEIFAKHPDWAAFQDAKTETIGVNKAYFDNMIDWLNKGLEKAKVSANKVKNGEVCTSYDLVFSLLDEQNIDNHFIPWLNKNVQKYIQQTVRKYKADPKSISRFEADQVLSQIKDLAHSANRVAFEPLAIIKEVANKFPDYFKTNFKDISFYENLSKNNQMEACMDILSNLGKNNIDYNPTSLTNGASLYQKIYHEMGHLLHSVNSTLKDKESGVLSKKSIEKFMKNSDKLKTAEKVSEYAKTNPEEFVAETFSALCAGKKVPDDVMEMYKYYKGPMIPNM